MAKLTQKIRVSNAPSHRTRDENGFIHVDWSPILKAGILEYMGKELLADGSDEVDGVRVDPDKIYKVYLSEEELEKGKDTFCGLPLLDDHKWMGVDGDDPKGNQQGSIGSQTKIEGGALYAPLSFTGYEAIDDLEEHRKEELSSSYTNRLTAAKPGADYDFVATDIKGNHVALVERGRCGPDVRVLNSYIKEIKMAARKLRVGNKKFKVVNEAKLILDGKEVDLDRFFEEEREERDDGKDIHEESIEEVSNEDKREIIREIMAVSAKADSDFEGGEDEKVREIAKLAEKLAYNPSERSETDNKRGPCSTNEDIDEEDDKARSENSARLMNAAIENLKRKQDQEIKAARRAYNSVSAAIGRDFNPFGMSETEILAYGLKELGYEGLNGTETAGELRVAMNAMSQVRRVDNSFEPSLASAAEDEVSINV